MNISLADCQEVLWLIDEVMVFALVILVLWVVSKNQAQ